MMKPVHAHYYEVEADTHTELGEKLGILFGPLTERTIARARKQKGWEEKVAVSKPLLVETQTYFPEYAEELEAYARVAGVPFLDMWVLSLEGELDSVGYEKCTTVVTNGGKLILHNEDWKHGKDSICILKRKLPGLTTLELHYYSAPLGGTSITVNSRGSLQAIDTLTHRDKRVGVPRNVIARWLSETSGTEADFEELQSLPRSSGYNHIFVDRRGTVRNIESSATQVEICKPALPFAHTNHFLLERMREYEARMEDALTFTRYQCACELMKETMTVAEAKALCDNTSCGGKASIANYETIGKVVVDLERSNAKIWLKRESDKGWVDYSLDFMVV